MKTEMPEQREKRLAKQRLRNKRRYYSMTPEERCAEYQYTRARYFALSEEEKEERKKRAREYSAQWRKEMKVNR